MFFVFTMFAQILIEVHLCPSPLTYLRIILFVDNRKDVLSKERNAEIGVGAERFSEYLLSFFSLEFEQVQSFLE